MIRCSTTRCLKSTTNIIGFIPVAFIVALLLWIYYAYVFLFFGDNYAEFPILCIFYLIIFHILFSLHAYSYYKVIFTNPGKPPRVNTQNDDVDLNDAYHPNAELIDTSTYSYEQLTMVTAKRDGRPRTCRKCSNMKPDRTHHCSVCGTCVLKFDQVNNCVGFYNQKFFVLFTFYSSILGGFVFLSLLSLYASRNNGGFYGANLNIVFLGITGIVFCIALAGFTIIHISFVLYNKTTVESFERHRYKATGGIRSSKHYVNIFDLGKYENWCQVMGPNKWLWFVPVGNRYHPYNYMTVIHSIGNGIEFKYNQEAYNSLLQLQTDEHV